METKMEHTILEDNFQTQESVGVVPHVYSLIENLKLIAPDIANRFSKIASDISEGQKLSEWSSIDIWSVINPDNIEERAFHYYLKIPNFVKSWELVRNVSVFMPITITWFGLSLATQFYKNSPSSDDSFLLLWERGKLGPLSFSLIGYIDILFLALVLISTFIVHWNQDFKQNEASKKAAKLRLQIEEALWSFEQILMSERAAQNSVSPGNQFNATLDLIDKQMREFGKFAQVRNEDIQSRESLERAIVDMKETISTITEANQLYSSTNSKITGLYTQINSSFDKLGDRLEQIGMQQKGLVGSLDPLISYLDTIRAISNSLNNAIEELRGGVIDGEQDRKKFLSLAAQISAALENNEQTKNVLRTAVEELKNTSVDFSKRMNKLSVGKESQQSNQVLNYGVFALVFFSAMTFGISLIQLLTK